MHDPNLIGVLMWDSKTLYNNYSMEKIMLGALPSNTSCSARFKFNRSSNVGCRHQVGTKEKKLYIIIIVLLVLHYTLCGTVISKLLISR